MYEYKAIISRVIDGDTMLMDIDLGFKIHTSHKIRLSRINCPEMNTDMGVIAQTFVKDFEEDTVRIISSKEDKYGRYLAEVYVKIDDTEVNLNDYLVSKGLAKLY